MCETKATYRKSTMKGSDVGRNNLGFILMKLFSKASVSHKRKSFVLDVVTKIPHRKFTYSILEGNNLIGFTAVAFV